jgi:hypothetical protein
VQPDGFGSFGQIRLDRQGNLFVVDASHEGWQCSNNRVLQWDKAPLMPDPNRDFFCGATDAGCTTPRAPRRVYVAGNPNATGAMMDFSKPVMQRKGWMRWDLISNGDDAPNIPFNIAFDANNRMLMVCDGYGNPNDKRVFYYANPLPACSAAGGCYVPHTKVFPVMSSQPADVSFDASNNSTIMDHTWNRVLFFGSSDVNAWLASN